MTDTPTPDPLDWAARRKSIADRWPFDGMPMSRFEMTSAVEWDAITKNPQKAEYHRRGLLNVVAELMDRVARLNEDLVARPSPDSGLREALERMREFAEHDPNCIFAVDLSGVNGDERAINPARCSCGFDGALALYDAERSRPITDTRTPDRDEWRIVPHPNTKHPTSIEIAAPDRTVAWLTATTAPHEPSYEAIERDAQAIIRDHNAALATRPAPDTGPEVVERHDLTADSDPDNDLVGPDPFAPTDDTHTPDPLTIAEARKLDRDHPGVWFCACGARWLGTAEGYPDDLHSHARFRAEYEPGAAHDPGLATFRPDTLAARSAPDTGLREDDKPPVKWATIRQDASERGLFSVVDEAMIGRKLTPSRRRLIVGNIVMAVARWRQTFRDCGCWRTADGYVLCSWHEEMLQSQVGPLRAALTAHPAPDSGPSREHHAVIRGRKMVCLCGQPHDHLAASPAPDTARHGPCEVCGLAADAPHDEVARAHRKEATS